MGWVIGLAREFKEGRTLKTVYEQLWWLQLKDTCVYNNVHSLLAFQRTILSIFFFFFFFLLHPHIKLLVCFLHQEEWYEFCWHCPLSSVSCSSD